MAIREAMGSSRSKKHASRRRFLKSGAAVAAAATVASPQVSRAQTTILRMQGAWGPADIFHDMALEYVSRVEEMAGGRLKVDYLVAGTVVPAFRLHEEVHGGRLDAGHTVTAYWRNRHKAASLFGGGPVFGTDAAQNLAWIHKGGGRALYRQLVQDILKRNLVGFFCMPAPAQPLGWFKRKIDSVQDLKGLKYRTVGEAAEIMDGVGLSVVQIPGGEILTSMESGRIEAFEYENPTSDSRLGAQNVAKNYVMGSFHQAAMFFEIIFNRNVFVALPAEHQAILEYAAEAASTANYATAMQNYPADLQELIDAHGVKVHRAPRDVMKAQLEAWDAVLDDLMKDPFFAKVVESQRQWAKRVGYYSLMNAADHKLAWEHHFGKLDT
jgi:TRAP-type mannitol/chloroaromatic compound transport system substrate-binding protein